MAVGRGRLRTKGGAREDIEACACVEVGSAVAVRPGCNGNSNACYRSILGSFVTLEEYGRYAIFSVGVHKGSVRSSQFGFGGP